MTNQAAQTMPSVVAFMAKWEWLILSRCRDEFLADLAALSQPAGVAEGWKLVPAKPTEAMLSAMDMCLMAGPADAYRAMLAAAPAASGGDDERTIKADRYDMIAEAVERSGVRATSIVDYCTSLIDRALPPSGASVSERAVEMLAQEVEKDMTACADDIRAGKLHGMAAASVRAIVRALSSPRQEGEAVATVCHDTTLALVELSVNLAPGTKLYTQPSTAASTQGLREAAHAFLEAADARDNEETATQYPDYGLRLRQYKAAREDLESLLTSPTTGADGGGE